MTAQLLTVFLGLFVGLALGTLGGGGSTLAVPILVFVAGLSAQDATAASLIVVGSAAGVGVLGHYRNGNVRLGAGVAFGAAGFGGSRIGTLMNQSLPEQVLLVAFSAVILIVAVRMYQSARVAPLDPLQGRRNDALAAEAVPVRGDVLLTAARPTTRLDLSAPALAKLAAAATAVGILTGLFGVGGGFAVVPALTLLLGFRAKEAVGTSLVVIAINAAVALLMRAGDLAIDWGLVAPFLGTVAVGALIGSQLSDRVNADRLTRSFAIMLGCVAAYTAVNAFAV